MQAKTFAKRSFLLMGSSLLRMLVQVAIIILFSRKLSIAEYGLYQSLWMYLNIFSLISLFGLPSILLSNSPTVVLTWIKQHISFFALLAITLNLLPLLYIYTATNNYSDTTKLLLFCLMVLQNIAIITETIIIKKEKEQLQFITNIIFIVGYFLCHIIILFYHYSLNNIIIGISFMYIIKFMLQWKYTKSEVNIYSIQTNEHLGKQWLLLGINDIVGVIFKWVDKWFILLFISLSQFAIYFNGSYEIPIYGLMLSAVGNIMLVDYSKNAGNLGQKTKLIFEHSTKLLSRIVFPSFCFLLFFYQDIFNFIFGSKFESGLPIFLITIFIIPLRITNFTAVLQVLNRSDIILKGAVMDLLVAIVFMCILYPLYGINGLAISCVFSTYLQAAFYLCHTSKLVNEKIGFFIPFKKLFSTMLISVLVLGITLLLANKMNPTYKLLIGFCSASCLILFFNLYHFKKIK